MSENLSVGQAAPLVHPKLSPKAFSNFLYANQFGRELPVVSGRKQIPRDIIDVFRSEMRAGKLPTEEVSNVNA